MDDPVKHSHVYKMMVRVNAGEPWVDFELPTWRSEGALWTELYIGASRRIGTSVSLFVMSKNGSMFPLKEMMGVELHEWTPLPWALPTSPCEEHTLVVRLHLTGLSPFQRKDSSSEAEYVQLKLLGFEQLYRKGKTDFVLTDCKGATCGRFLYRTAPDDLLGLGVFVPTKEIFVDSAERLFLVPLAAL
jgi:hypothetical protein